LAQEWQNLKKINPIFYDEQHPTINEATAHHTTFTLNWQGQKIAFTTNLVGHHNILNLSAVLLFGLKEGFNVASLQQAVQNLSLVKRRQEVRGVYQGSVVIDDFAHHPRAVAETIKAVQTAYQGKEVVVVFDPHSATARSDIFEKEFTASLSLVKHVCLTAIDRPTSVKNHQDINLAVMAQNLAAQQIQATVAADLKTLRQWLLQNATPQRVILILSNGTCLGLWESDFVQELSKEQKLDSLEKS
jgi:UDP-N-acetylmuramate: L-alanyl-gamma-D-glutamyl-meso-diaminopimelate ligase